MFKTLKLADYEYNQFIDCNGGSFGKAIKIVTAYVMDMR